MEYLYSKGEIYSANWFMKSLVFMVLPAAIYIYRARLLSLKPFVSLKKHSVDKIGIAYNTCLQNLNYLFCCSNLKKMNYIEYIMYKRQWSS